MGDITEDNGVDLPSCYSTCIPSWNEQYTAAFSRPDGIPKEKQLIFSSLVMVMV